jgi:hypothetical protein
MVKRLRPGEDRSRGGAPDEETIGELQKLYSAARLASGDLPPDVLAKIELAKELSAKFGAKADLTPGPPSGKSGPLRPRDDFV